MALAQEMMMGFKNNSDVYPAPTTTVIAQKARIDSAQILIDKVTQAEAALQAAVMEKDAEIELMDEEMSENIAYADLIAKGDDAKLKLISWSGRVARQPQQTPGQPRVLEIVNQGAGWF